MKHSLPPTPLLRAAVLVAGLLTAGGVYAVPECAISKETVSLPDGKVSYEKVGTGQPVVLVHGLFANKEQWNPMVCKLAAVGWQVVVPDLPRFGASTDFKAADDYKLERQVEHLDQFLTALNLPAIQLAGNSMGGAITTLYTRTHPERVKSLTLIGAPLGLGGWGPDVQAVLQRGDIPFILEKSGHLPQYEDADAMVAAWLAFQAGLKSAAK